MLGSRFAFDGACVVHKDVWRMAISLDLGREGADGVSVREIASIGGKATAFGSDRLFNSAP